MNKRKIAAAECYLEPLSTEEMQFTNGGSVWGELAYLVGATIKSYVVFCKTASDYQASLPANLKK